MTEITELITEKVRSDPQLYVTGSKPNCPKSLNGR